MRLICPNCGAQYEVPADAIPPGGRDVQCSNCAHTWLEKPGASEAAEAEDAQDGRVAEPTGDADDHGTHVDEDPEDGAPDDVTDGDDSDAPDETPEETPPPASASSETMSAVASLVSGAAAKDAADTTEPEAAQSGVAAKATAEKTPVRQTLSPSVAEILREEAAREEAARRAEASTVESQPDLDLDRPVDREEQLAEEARRRMARLKGEPSVPISAPVTQTSGARSDLLPDIEEISSSLRSSADRATNVSEELTAEVAEERQRRGFRFGFTLVVAICAVLALVYVFADEISEAVPAAEPTLASYVETVNKGRLWLDLQLQSLLDGTTAETGETPEAPATN